MRRAVMLALAAQLAAVFIISCGPSSEEARLRAFLKETVAMAEKRDLAGVMARLADDYSDFEGRDKTATEALVRDYFRETGIVIHLLGLRLRPGGPAGETIVETEAFLSSGAAEVFRKLVRLAGECYRFELHLAKASPYGWQIVWARWEAVPFSDLFPESLAMLKKLFPEI